MAILPLNKKDIPFLLGGKGEIAIDTGKVRPLSAIPEETATVFNVGFNAAGSEKIALGGSDTVKIGVSTKANATLTPVFSTSPNGAKVLKASGLGDFFKRANTDKVVLVFDVGASGDASVAGSFTYSALKASVELDAGADAGYTYARALDKKLKVEQILPAFFKTMRLPEQGDRAPEPGEAISLRYGGYLKFAAEVSAGYQLAGSKGVSIGQLALSEKYDLSILGKVGLSAGVAGRYSILVTAADLPGWARVQVRRHRSKDLKIAADVTVDFKNELTNLPADAHEFLGAVLGTNAKNFLNVFDKALELSDFEKFKGAIDGLARKYIEEFIGKGFDTLASKTELQKFLARVNTIVTSYQTLEDRAVTLFDRHFDKLDELTDFLEQDPGPERRRPDEAPQGPQSAVVDHPVAAHRRRSPGIPAWASERRRHEDRRARGAAEARRRGARSDSGRCSPGDPGRDCAGQTELRHRQAVSRARQDRHGRRTEGAGQRQDRLLRHAPGRPHARLLEEPEAGARQRSTRCSRASTRSPIGCSRRSRRR